MPNTNMEELPVIGTYCLCNTGAVLVHEIEPHGDWIVASINGEDPQRYELTWRDNGDEDEDGEVEVGFWMGEMWIPLDQIMRV